MLELDTSKEPTKEQPETVAPSPPPSPLHKNWDSARVALLKAWQVIDDKIPNYRSADAMADAIARRTPATIVVCFALLLAGVIASRLGVWSEGFLWGIPSLGAIGMGIGMWALGSNLMLRSDLSDEARDRLRRAIRLQWTMVIAGALALAYFFGMAANIW
jgi:hypothetical protein